MGLLNNWLKKNTKEQLEQTNAKAKPVSKEKKAVKAAKEVKAVEEKHDHEHDHGHEHEHEHVKTSGKKHVLPAGSIAHRVLLRPLVTEKSAVAESMNKYSFIVAKWATKTQIKKAVADIYKVVPCGINMANVDGKRVRFGRNQGRRSDYKKAIVSLPHGKTIDIHTGV
jgi:large subunit ribosomal protein L23